MSEDIEKTLLDKAFFIAGNPADTRHDGDPKALSAVRDAKAFIASLPKSIQEPKIHSGTTNNPNQVLSLSWMIGGYPCIKSVTVFFRGNKRYDLSWDSPEGETQYAENVDFSKLRSLSVPRLVMRLIRRSGNNAPSLKG